jgi:NitT/TauT family transport system substrate-binding protein
MAKKEMIMRLGRRLVLTGLLGTAWFATSGFGPEDKTITLALQEGGTASWEIAAMTAAGLDAYHHIKIEVRGVADSRAGQVALQAGEVDVILSDFIWVSSQRNQGADFTIVPHSLTVGGLMVDPAGPVKSVADLEGETLAVAGGPVDKSYIFLQAYFNSKTGKVLPDLIQAKFGAPPLVNELLIGGQAQAALNFWHFNTRARVAGMVELISVKDMLAEMGVSKQPPLLGWVFKEKTGRTKKEEVQRFLDASFATKEKLLTDDAIWDTIRPGMRGAETDDALFLALRDAYRVGIVTSYGPADIQAATESYALIAKFGGSDVIGDKPDMAAGTFWSGYSK